jgi:hypothetical protein
MIPWSGPVNIPVEDKSYKWSKKILKAAPGIDPFYNNCHSAAEIPVLKMYFCTLINVHGNYSRRTVEADQLSRRSKKTPPRKASPGLR